jgi:anti-anti-sigma factor
MIPGDDEVTRLLTVVHAEGDHRTVILTGELDQITSPALADLLSAATDGVRRLVVDLDQVYFCDLAAVRVLVQAHRSAADRGVTLTVRNPQLHILWLLQITDTADLLLGDNTADPDTAT